VKFHRNSYICEANAALNMDQLSDRLERLHLQFDKLKVVFQKMQEQQCKLQEENAELHEQLSRKREKIKALKDEQTLIVNAKSLKEVGLDSKQARHKINELVRGIDKCIAQLNE